jgi:hypothetical protein
MSGFDNNMTGVMSRNERRERDTQPEFTGNATIDNVDYFVDAWVNERKDGSGRKFFKMKFKRKDQQQNTAGRPRGSGREIVDDEVPL